MVLYVQIDFPIQSGMALIQVPEVLSMNKQILGYGESSR